MSNGIDKFFEIAQKRYQIMLDREAGKPKPWTNDSILQSNRFCNVFREDDKTTRWLKEHIRDPLNKAYAINPAIILLGIVAFRWFNRIETWDIILSSGRLVEDIFAQWDSDWIKQELLDHSNPPWVTGAYVIKTPDGKNKLDGVLSCIDEFKNLMDRGRFNKIILEDCSHQEAQRLLEGAPYLGRFTAYQIIADARYTCLLNKSPDINIWAQPGPGSTRGIGRIFYNDVDKFAYGQKRDEQEVIALMQELLEYSRSSAYWPNEWPQWEMQVVQNWCCEFDKYIRCEQGGKMKRKYDAA